MGGNVKTMKDLRDCVEGALQILLALFAIGLLALAPVYATRGRVDIAGTLAGLFLLSMLTLVLPRLRAIEAFGVKAQLAEEIRKAEITLDQLKSLARSSARQGFLQVWSLPLAERRAVVDSLNATMKAAEFTDDEQAVLRRPMMDAVARDLLSLGQRCAIRLRTKVQHEIDRGLRALPAPVHGAEDPNEPERQRLREQFARLSEPIFTPNPNVTPTNLNGLLDQCLGNFPRSEIDDGKLRAILASARTIMKDCLEGGCLTPDFVDIDSYLYQHNGWFANANAEEEATDRLFRSRFTEGR